MSEQTTQERPSVELPFGGGDSAFGALMDALAPEGEGAKAAGGEGVAGGAADGAAGAPAVEPAAGDARRDDDKTDHQGRADGGDAPAGGGAGEAGPAAGGPDAGAGAPDAGAGGPAEGGPQQPAAAGADPAAVAPELGRLSTAIEERLTKAYQTEAYEKAREEFSKYFEALEKHPRLLVGTEVPAVGREGMERLKDSNDAKEWQEAIRGLLVQEIKDRAQVRMDESKQILETVHASIGMFQKNPDLIPGTRGFDRDLADRFAKLAGPYEVRADGKLQGYSIPVQPLIDSLRAQKKAAAPPAQAAAAAAPAAPPPADPPQAGITSKAGSTGEKEDFSTLFGTIGLPHLKI